MDLKERLYDHAKAFDGLLSLIPAKIYYGEDTSEQWKAQRQSRDIASAARRGKLDPDSKFNRNAKEVMDERAQMKRNRQHENGESAPTPEDKRSPDNDTTMKQIFGQGLRTPRETNYRNGAQNLGQLVGLPPKAGCESRANLNSSAGSLARKAITNELEKAKVGGGITMNTNGLHDTPTQLHVESRESRRLERSRAESDDKTMCGYEPSTITHVIRSASKPSIGDSTLLASPQQLATSECSKPAGPDTAAVIDMMAIEAPDYKYIKVPINTEALKARLAAKIEALRVARKADGTHGRPIRSRQELIEARRVKQTQRKAHKQELRQQAKMAERKSGDALLSNSPSVASPSLDPGDQDSCFAFGRVAFTDGSQLSHGLDYVLNREGVKNKGPSDPKTALLKLQNQKKRLAELDDEQRHDIEGKEVWLTARQRAEGHKIRNDETMLKRAVKRKDQAKKKSKREWDDRTRSVELSIKERQRKRDINIQKRRDEKMINKAGQKDKKASVAIRAMKGKRRPGFEGSSMFGSKKK